METLKTIVLVLDLISAVLKSSLYSLFRFRIDDHGNSLFRTSLCQGLCLLHHFKADPLRPAAGQFKKHPDILIAHGLPPHMLLIKRPHVPAIFQQAPRQLLPDPHPESSAPFQGQAAETAP